jgi:hypothetical protein
MPECPVLHGKPRLVRGEVYLRRGLVPGDQLVTFVSHQGFNLSDEFVARKDIETIVGGNDHFFSIRHFHFEKKPAFSRISEHDIL